MKRIVPGPPMAAPRSLPPKTGLGAVMSGGGARGAYEVGVLSYLYSDFIDRYKRVPRFDVMSGTSVGAINCTALASTANDPQAGMKLLQDVWKGPALSNIFQFSLKQASRLYRVWLGGNRPVGLFDSAPLARLISHEIPWRQLVRNLKAGHLRALTVSATNIRTGRAWLYVDRAPGVAMPRGSLRVVVHPTHILPQHVLASAAMPLVFPPVRIGNDYFFDGGIRLNTPTAPAIQLGVNRIFVIGVTTPPGDAPGLAPLKSPGAPFLLGKALDALMLDHIEHDIEGLELVNDILGDAIAAGGPDFLDKLNAAAAASGRPPRHVIDTFAIHPSVDIGQIAGDHLRRSRTRFGRIAGDTVQRFIEVGDGADADLASYMLFDTDFVRALIDLGRQDAAKQADLLADFLFREDDSA